MVTSTPVVMMTQHVAADVSSPTTTAAPSNNEHLSVTGELNGNDGKPKSRFNKQILEVTVYRDLLKTVPIFSQIPVEFKEQV